MTRNVPKIQRQNKWDRNTHFIRIFSWNISMAQNLNLESYKQQSTRQTNWRQLFFGKLTFHSFWTEMLSKFKFCAMDIFHEKIRIKCVFLSHLFWRCILEHFASFLKSWVFLFFIECRVHTSNLSQGSIYIISSNLFAFFVFPHFFSIDSSIKSYCWRRVLFILFVVIVVAAFD